MTRDGANLGKSEFFSLMIYESREMANITRLEIFLALSPVKASTLGGSQRCFSTETSFSLILFNSVDSEGGYRAYLEI
jgi:hypothetical protein